MSFLCFFLGVFFVGLLFRLLPRSRDGRPRLEKWEGEGAQGRVDQEEEEGQNGKG